MARSLESEFLKIDRMGSMKKWTMIESILLIGTPLKKYFLRMDNATVNSQDSCALLKISKLIRKT